MPNMSYCQFENTYQDLKDCADALDECESLSDFSESEKKYAKKILALCARLADYTEEFEED